MTDTLPPVPQSELLTAGFRCDRCGDWKPVREFYKIVGKAIYCASCAYIYEIPDPIHYPRY